MRIDGVSKLRAWLVDRTGSSFLSRPHHFQTPPPSRPQSHFSAPLAEMRCCLLLTFHVPLQSFCSCSIPHYVPSQEPSDIQRRPFVLDNTNTSTMSIYSSVHRSTTNIDSLSLATSNLKSLPQPPCFYKLLCRAARRMVLRATIKNLLHDLPLFLHLSDVEALQFPPCW